MGKDFTKLFDEFNKREVCLQSGPAVMYVASVEGCPYTCAMCKPESTKPKKISPDLLKKIEPHFKDLDVLAIHGYGEPLLGDLDYFVEQSIKHDFVVHMNSTGFFLTEKKVELLAKTRLSIRFSIHSGTKETYKKIMGQDFDKVLHNISCLTKKTESNGQKADLWFSYLVMKENVNEIEPFLHLSHECGIKSIRFMRLDPRVRNTKNLKMLDRDFVFNFQEQNHKSVREQFLKKLPEYEKLAKKLGIKIEFGNFVHNPTTDYLKQLANRATTKICKKQYLPLAKKAGICLAPWFGQLIINQEGNVKMCCAVAFDYSLGNLNNTPLGTLWNSEQMQQVRASFKKGYFPHVCGYCKGFGFSEYPNNSKLRNLV